MKTKQTDALYLINSHWSFRSMGYQRKLDLYFWWKKMRKGETEVE